MLSVLWKLHRYWVLALAQQNFSSISSSPTTLKISLWAYRNWLLLVFPKPPACRFGRSPRRCSEAVFQRLPQIHLQLLFLDHNGHLLFYRCLGFHFEQKHSILNQNFPLDKNCIQHLFGSLDSDTTFFFFSGVIRVSVLRPLLLSTPHMSLFSNLVCQRGFNFICILMTTD